MKLIGNGVVTATMPPRARSPMKRFAVLLLVSAAVMVAGFVVGWAGLQAWRWMTAPSPLRHGNFSAIVAEVGSPVVLVSPSPCPWCQRTRAWLNDARVDYRDCVVDQDPFARELIDRLGVDVVPQLVTADQVVTGYDEELFQQVVARPRQPIAMSSHAVRCVIPGRADEHAAASSDASGRR